MDILRNKAVLGKLKSIAKKYNLAVLILFGSRASSKHKKDSDYDFAFYTNQKFKVKEEIALFEDIMGVLKIEKIDLININTNHCAHLRYEVFSKGVCLYEKKEGIFAFMRGNAWVDYMDYKRFEKNRLNLLKKDIEESLA